VHLTVVFSVALHAQDAEELFRQGSRAFAAQDRPAAIAAFRNSLQLRPDFAPAWKALGVVFASQGDFESAEDAFRNACERQPALADACLYHGRSLYLLNRFQPAVNTLRTVLQREKENSEAWRLLALSLEGLGDIPPAGDAFRQAVRFNRGASPNEDPGIDYGVYLFRQGRAEEAIVPLDAAARRHPDSFRAQLELGCVQLALDRLAEAAARLERAIALEPRGARAHLLLGKVYQRLGKDREAAEQFRLGANTK
jgi:Tfp pilus assembly protein PilF